MRLRVLNGALSNPAMRFERIDLVDLKPSLLRMRYETYENGYEALEIGPAKEPLRLSINITQPPVIKPLGTPRNTEILSGHVCVKGRNKLIITADRCERKDIAFIYIETILPTGFKGIKPLQVMDSNEVEQNQRIYCDRLTFFKSKSGFMGSKFHAFTMLFEGDKAYVSHTDPNVGQDASFVVTNTGGKLVVVMA